MTEDRSDGREDRPGESAGGQAQKGIVIHLSSRPLLGLCAVQFVLLLALVLMNWMPLCRPARAPGKGPQAYTATPQTTSSREPFFHGSPGPWGELEYARINIEPPDELDLEDALSSGNPQWFFADYTRAQLTAFLNSCDLSAAQRTELLNPAAWSEEAEGILLAPSDKLILGLPPQARTQIYSVLAESPRNDFQFWPYVFRSGGFDDWFEQSGLSNDTLARVRRLIYHRGTALCFSDMPQLLSQIPDPAERRRLAKTLARNSTVLMKLRVRPDTDIHALLEYWAGHGRAKDVEPLLESLAKVPGGMTIDVVHLLPPFARKRLNTYPDPDSSSNAPDCYWTAMNFFNDPPDDRYHDHDIWSQELKRDYTIVTEPTYGDLVFLLPPDGVPFHAAVYIADNVVFTKNGSNCRKPWILMKLEDLLAYYPQTQPVRVAFFRANKRGG
jgi:hypothetical protein